jgi:hypothetical protein
MSKLKLTMLAVAIGLSIFSVFQSQAQPVDVFDEKYEGSGQVSFVVGQGDVQTQVYAFLQRLYPNTQVIFKNTVTGFLLAEVEISGSSVEYVATDILAGLGLSACFYANNVIEVGLFKKKGICSSAKLPSGQMPEVKRYGDGIFTITNEWFGGYSNQGLIALNNSHMGAIKASYYSTNIPTGTADIDGSFNGFQAEDNSLHLSSTSDGNTELKDNITPPLVGAEFTMSPGALAPQIRKLVLMLDNSPEVVWRLDDNTQWFNSSVIRRDTYLEILADILDSYNAFADVYENDVLVVRSGDIQ